MINGFKKLMKAIIIHSSRPFCCSLGLYRWPCQDDYSSTGWRLEAVDGPRRKFQEGCSTMGSGHTREPIGPCGASQLTGSPGWPPGVLSGLDCWGRSPVQFSSWDEEESSPVPLLKSPDVCRRMIWQSSVKIQLCQSVYFSLVTFSFSFIHLVTTPNGYK